MSNKYFSKKKAIKYGWNTTFDNIGFFLGLWVIGFLLYFIPHIIAVWSMQVNTFLGVVLHIVDYLITIIVGLGLIKIGLSIYDKGKSSYGELLSQYNLIIPLFIAAILYTIAVGIGTLLFIIPGIVLGIKFFFFDYLIVDQKMGPLEALKESSYITNGAKWDFFLLSLLLFLINLLGALFFLIGLLVTIPTSYLAVIYVYRKLTEPEEVQETEVSTETVRR